jgi:integral membrane protein
MLLSLIRKFESNQVFSEEEAWMLFRIAAILEACGWTLLIIGILFERYILPGNNVSVLLAGRTHGVLFLLYVLAAVGLYPNLNWSRKRSFIALIASVPPYGSLLFEQWAQYIRNRSSFKIYSRCILFALICEEEA